MKEILLSDLYSKYNDTIIMKSIVGSNSFGLNTETSDIDIHGVYIMPMDYRVSYKPQEQISNETNDITFWDISKYLEMLSKANPSALELLYSPQACIQYKHPKFNIIPKQLFLTKQCKDTYVKYATSQIKRASGLNKKVFSPISEIAPTVFDFCYVQCNNGSINIKEYLQSMNIDQKYCALTTITHMDNLYALYYQDPSEWKLEPKRRWGHGIVHNEYESKDIQLNSIPIGINPIAVMSFNKNAYSMQSKKYTEYWNWMKIKNNSRYEKTLENGKGYDSKNMMHTFRLLLTAKDIVLTKSVVVDRTKDREFLFKIKNGEYEYDNLIKMADDLSNEIIYLFDNSDLPDLPPDIEPILFNILDIRN
jgi:hypothetical protein